MQQKVENSARTTVITFKSRQSTPSNSPIRQRPYQKHRQCKAFLFKKNQSSSSQTKSCTPFDFQKWLQQAKTSHTEREKEEHKEQFSLNSVYPDHSDILMKLYGHLRNTQRKVASPAVRSARITRAKTVASSENIKISLKEANRMSSTSQKKVLAFSTTEFKTQLKEQPQRQARLTPKPKGVANNFTRKKLAGQVKKERIYLTNSQVQKVLEPSGPLPISSNRSHFRKLRRDWKSVDSFWR